MIHGFRFSQLSLKYSLFSLFLGFLLLPQLAFADESFEQWKADFRGIALSEGISAEVLDSAFAGLSPDQKVIELDSRQPEFTKPIWEYLDVAVSETRISNGRENLNANIDLLERVESRYGVPAEYIVAIWGIESNYGNNFGDRNVIRSLATLAWQGRRQSFGREQLMAALRIIQNGDISADRMVGSWAGAMGHTQFIPTTFEQYAVDFDGDGRRNLWDSRADAFASTANYLDKSGWRSQESWGQEVQLPSGFDWSLADPKHWVPVGTWNNQGIRDINGRELHHQSRKATVLLPAGSRGPAFLMYKNFKVIKRYNNANSYALAVAYLGDKIKGRDGLHAAWPRDDVPLSRSEKSELQQLLTARGFDTDGVDGIIGPNSRKAIRTYQQNFGLPSDGYANQKLLSHVRGLELN